jgi:hypothetical protein
MKITAMATIVTGDNNNDDGDGATCDDDNNNGNGVTGDGVNNDGNGAMGEDDDDDAAMGCNDYDISNGRQR